jgi:hypothetical protein
MDSPWSIEDIRMLREQIRVADKAFNYLNTEHQEILQVLQQITTPATIEHLREQLRMKRKYATT